MQKHVQWKHLGSEIFPNITFYILDETNVAYEEFINLKEHVYMK
jgi:hypothetical protein